MKTNPFESPHPSGRLSKPAHWSRALLAVSSRKSKPSGGFQLRGSMLALAGLALFTSSAQAQVTDTIWNMTAATPSASGTNVLGSSITSGNNNGTTTLLTSTSVSNFSGASAGNNAGAAARTAALNTAANGSAYFEVTLTPQNGATLTVSEINFGSRGTSTGPQAYSVRTSTDSYATDFVTGALLANSTWALKTNSGLSLAFSSAVTFRIYGYNGAGSASVNTANWRLDDLTFKTSSSGGGDVTPPAVSSLSPADEATGVVNGSNLVVTFSENVVTIPAATGTIEIHKSASPFDLVESFLITSTAVTVSGNTMTINPTSDLTYSTGYYVTVAAGVLEDTAGNDFAGILASTYWNFTTESAPVPPPVVINKYLNGTPDMVELLVTGNGVTGTTWDLRGMIIKDFSGNMGSDGGGNFTFSTASLWSAVPVGTLVVLSKSAVSSDTNSADFNLSVGLDDTVYFTSGGGSFDISTTDMVMIKAASATAPGVVGSIHTLAGGAAGSQFTSVIGPKLISSGTTGTGIGAIASNATSTISDYSGTGATSASLTAVDFGVPSNLANVTYVYALRGTTPGDGSGLAAVTNATVGSFSGKNIFSSNQTDNQSVKIALNAQVPGVTLTDVEITVPVEMGVPAGVSVTGTGAGTPVSGISGQVITLSGLALTNVNLADITVSGLDTPVTTAASNGNLPFIVKTAKSGGTPAVITTQPVARVIIPIEALRDVDANGVTLDAGTIVAVEGVCTEAQFYTTNTLAVLQDGNFGVTVFSSTPTGNPFIRGKRYAVLGSVGQFNGVTQVTPASFTNVVDLGTAAEPAPLVITIPDLLATPELYEGRLVTVQNISRAPGDTAWGSAAVTSTAVNMLDTASPTPNSIAVLITNNSGAFTAPPAAADITGIFSQNDNSSPYLSTYQLLPRAQADVLSLGSAYDLWIGGYYSGVTNPLIVGFTADPDLDGLANGVEALIGGNPSQFGFFAATDLVKTGNVFTFFYPQASAVPSGVIAAYQWSTDMVNWQAGGVAFGGDNVTLADELWDNSNPAFTVYKVTATVTAGSPVKLFVRVGAHN